MPNEDDDAQRRMIIGLHNLVRYSGACPWKHLNTMTAVLKVIRCRTGSQCKLRSSDILVIKIILVIVIVSFLIIILVII